MNTYTTTLANCVAFYPINLAKTLIQLGYEPVLPDANGNLPNIFSYISIIKRQRGMTSLYTGLGYSLPAMLLKDANYNFMVALTEHKGVTRHSDTSEVIAVCLRESAFKIYSLVLVHPLTNLSIAYIASTFIGAKDIEYSVQALYRGIIPRLIFEVAVLWARNISKRMTAELVAPGSGFELTARLPPFLVSSLLYPLNVVATVMCDSGRSGLNPEFDDWRKCFKYLKQTHQLNRGASNFFRRDLSQRALKSRYSFML